MVFILSLINFIYSKLLLIEMLNLSLNFNSLLLASQIQVHGFFYF